MSVKITAQMVGELRSKTGAGMMDCKKALITANGAMEQAIDDLRKASGLKAAKKASRVAAEEIRKIRQGGLRKIYRFSHLGQASPHARNWCTCGACV